jgi:hypothetical protein
MPKGWVFSEPSVEMAQCPTVVLIAPLVDSLVESGKRLANDSPVSDIDATKATTTTRIAVRLDTLQRQDLWIAFFIVFLYPCSKSCVFVRQIRLLLDAKYDIKLRSRRQLTKRLVSMRARNMVQY